MHPKEKDTFVNVLGHLFKIIKAPSSGFDILRRLNI